MKNFATAFAALLLASTGTAQAGIVTTDTAGQITGITDLEVRDLFDDDLIGIFDVSFVEGTCADLFSGCDENSDFIVNTSADGGEFTAAMQLALGELSDPSSILGCESSDDCFITIPRALSTNGENVPGSALWIQSGLMNDLPITESFSLLRLDDTTLDPTRVFAVIAETTPVNPVPIPAAAPLFVIGAAGARLLARRRRSLAKS